MNEKFRFNRVLLKLSGEALKGAQEHGYDADAVRSVVERVKSVVDQGVEVALVVGAGNIWRGVMGRSGGMDRVNADYMGMLATVMNALCLRDFFRAAGIQAVVQCSIGMEPIAPRFNRDEAIRALEAGKIDRDLRRRHRQPVLHHRHDQRAAGARNRLRRCAEGDEGRRRLHRRSVQGPGGDAVCGAELRRGAGAPAESHGFDCVFDVP